MNTSILTDRQTADSLDRPKETVNWSEVETVLLDMDGTLLDKYFDDYFWEEYVPRVYSKKNGISLTKARQQLLDTYRQVEDTLIWTDLDYWSEQLGLDIVVLKKQVSHLIRPRASALEFLVCLKSHKRTPVLVTNAHPQTISIKMEQVDLRPYLSQIICSQDMGYAKEQPEFWTKLQTCLGFRAESTLMVDDTEKVLITASNQNIGHLLHIATPSSRGQESPSRLFPSITDFGTTMEALQTVQRSR